MHAQQELVNTTQSSSNKKMNTTFINNCIGRVHPLSIPNHPGRFHRNTDRLPKGINLSGSVDHKNKSKQPVHPLSNPNHPGRVHRNVDNLPKVINQNESEECKTAASFPNHQDKVPSHKAHKFSTLPNANHPGRIHRKMDKQPKGINQMTSVECKNNAGKPFHKAHRIHPLSNPNHPGRVHRKHQDKVPRGIHQCKPVKCKNNASPSNTQQLSKHHHRVHKKNTMSISYTVLSIPIASC